MGRPIQKPSMSALLDHWSISYKHVAGWQSILCPIQDESVPSFRVNIDGGGWKCLSCQASGNDTIALIQARENLGFRDAVQYGAAVPGASETTSKGFNPRLDRKPRYRRRRPV